MNDALSLEVLQNAFNEVVSQPDFASKVTWWLNSPHAAERWLQFELAYQIGRALAPNYISACEINRVDIAVFKPSNIFPLWNNKNKPVALLELKMIGNWWIQDNQVSGIAADIKKIRGYVEPSLALVFCTIFRAPRENRLFETLMDQMEACKTTCAEDVARRLESLNLRCIGRRLIEKDDAGPFECLDFHLLGHANESASYILAKCQPLSDGI